MHKEAAVAFTNKGYHMLLEKPMATLLTDCKEITMASRQNPKQVNAVCHVLRYFAPCIKIKELIDSRIIGDVVNINHTEPVGFWHFAHSFVRGNWHNEKESAFSLLAKCCHDIDLLMYWMSKKQCTKVSSFGSLFHFRKENAPRNSTENCFACECENSCPYSAKKIYLNPLLNHGKWPCSIVLNSEIQNIFENESIDIEDLLSKNDSEKRDLLQKCLENKKTTYGRCVYRLDNDVCDNQVVNMEFDDGATASLTMIAFSGDICQRKTKIYGTLGEIEWDDSKSSSQIVHYDFLTKKTNLIDCSSATPKTRDNPVDDLGGLKGHGGSDYWLMDSFIEAVLRNDKSLVLTDVEDSFKSHLIVFAAEESRLSKQVVDIDEFKKLNNILFA